VQVFEARCLDVLAATDAGLDLAVPSGEGLAPSVNCNAARHGRGSGQL
jgi:hypothetical protein